MPTLDFDISYVYDSLQEGIEVPFGLIEQDYTIFFSRLK